MKSPALLAHTMAHNPTIKLPAVVTDKTSAQLRAKLSGMARRDLEQFALNVVFSLFGEVPEDVEDPAELVLREDHEFDGDTVENVHQDILDAGLNPDKL